MDPHLVFDFPHFLLDLNALDVFVGHFVNFAACREAAAALFALSDGMANPVCVPVPSVPT